MAKALGVIYLIRAPNGKGYVGQTRRFRYRMEEHRRSQFSDGSKRECTALVSAIKKYGWDAMTVTILREGLTKPELDKAELELIAEYGTCNRKSGYNILVGCNADGSIPSWQRACGRRRRLRSTA